MKNLLILVVLVICLLVPYQVLPEQGKIQPSVKAENKSKPEPVPAFSYSDIASAFKLDEQKLNNAIQINIKDGKMDLEIDTAKLLVSRDIEEAIFSKELKDISKEDRERLKFLFPEFANYDEFAWFEKKNNLKQIWAELFNKLESRIIIMKFFDNAFDNVKVSDYDFENECFRIELIRLNCGYKTSLQQGSSEAMPFILIGDNVYNTLGGGTHKVSSMMDNNGITHYAGMPLSDDGYANTFIIYGFLYVKPDLAKEVRDKLKTGWAKIILFSYGDVRDNYERRQKGMFVSTHLYAYNRNFGKVVFAGSRNHTRGPYHLSTKDWVDTNIDLEDGKAVEVVLDNIPPDIEFKIRVWSEDDRVFVIKRSPPNETLCGKEALRIFNGVKIGKDCWEKDITFYGRHYNHIVLQSSKECDVNLMIFYKFN